MNTLIQNGDLQILKRMAEDPKLHPKSIFNYAREVDAGIAFSRWYRGDQIIKPRGRGAVSKTENANTPEVTLEPDEASIKVSVLKTLQITSNNARRLCIFFTEPNSIEELVMEYIVEPAKCQLMCACKRNKAEISPY